MILSESRLIAVSGTVQNSTWNQFCGKMQCCNAPLQRWPEIFFSSLRESVIPSYAELFKIGSPTFTISIEPLKIVITNLPTADLLGATLAQADFLPRLPQQRRLYEAAKAAILSQQLGAGCKLPSTRNLAKDLGIARNTIIAAFEQLAAEGFVVTSTGSGTYVSATLPAV